MAGYLLDTNVLSELMKKRPEPSVVQRVRGLKPDEAFTSSICIMELRFGAAKHPNGVRMWERIKKEILPLVSALPFGEREAQIAGETFAKLERRGTPIGIEDVWIGSTALMHELSVATRNVKHISKIDGLAVENWWA